MIDPSIWEDEAFCKLSYPARVLYIGLISNADDYGRGLGDLQSLKNKVFGYDKISLQSVSKWRLEVCQTLPNVLFYPRQSKKYYQLTKWKSYQYIREDRIRVSKIPPPTVRQVSDKRQTTDGIDKSSIDKNRIVDNSFNYKDSKEVLKEKMRFK